MLGIGLGGFVDGFARGYGMREEIKDRELAREERAEDRKYRAEEMAMRREDQAFQREERQFARSERQRTVDQRGRIDAIQSDTRQAFEAAVEKGKAEPDEFEKFWSEYALPRMQAEYILQNDVEAASALADWSETQGAKRGRKLFGQAMAATQMGDHDKALDFAIQAGREQGYIGNGFEIDEKEEITNKAGELVGYRVTLRDEDGNETQQDVAIEDIPTMVTRFANPEAAWNSQIETSNKKREQAEHLEQYEAEKQIDQKYSPTTNGTKDRAAAVKSLEEEYDGGVDGSEPSFWDLPTDEQESLIQDRMGALTGSRPPVAPASQVIVDTQSGQPVPAAAPTSQAVGLGESTSPAAAAAPVSRGMGIGAGPERPAPVIGGQEDTGLASPPTPRKTLNLAAQEMVSGGNPQEIATRLRAMQIPEHKWPSSITQALQQTGH